MSSATKNRANREKVVCTYGILAAPLSCQRNHLQPLASLSWHLTSVANAISIWFLAESAVKKLLVRPIRLPSPETVPGIKNCKTKLNVAYNEARAIFRQLMMKSIMIIAVAASSGSFVVNTADSSVKWTQVRKKWGIGRCRCGGISIWSEADHSFMECWNAAWGFLRTSLNLGH